MTLRKVLFWMHLMAGTFGGTVILIMSVTGVALMYEKQMLSWADQRGMRSEPARKTARQPMEALIGKVKDQRGALPSTVTLRADRAMPVAMAYGREATVYVNAYTGAVLGEGSATGLRTFFQVMTEWHRYVGAAGDGRSIGKAISGACNLAFLFIVLSGLYLWWPKQWTRQNLRSVTWFKRGLPGKARDFNWHNVIGLWCWTPLVLVVASATVISYPWASNLAYRIGGSEPPAAVAKDGGGKKGGGKNAARKGDGAPARAAAAVPSPPADLSLDGLDAMFQRAEQQSAAWETITLRLPTSERAPAVFTVDAGYAGQPQKRTTLTFDRATGDMRAEAFADLDSGRRFRTWLRFVHTGEYYGLAGQTIAGIASAGGAVLVYTGIALAWRRFRAWRKRRTRAPAERELAGVG